MQVPQPCLRPPPMPQPKGHAQQPAQQPAQQQVQRVGLMQWPPVQPDFHGDGSLPLFGSIAIPAAPPLQLPPSRCSSQLGSHPLQLPPSACSSQLGASHPPDLDSQGYEQLRQHSMPSGGVPPPGQRRPTAEPPRQHSLPAAWPPPPMPWCHEQRNNNAAAPHALQREQVAAEQTGAAPAAARDFHSRGPTPGFWPPEQVAHTLQQWQRQQQLMRAGDMCTPFPLPQLYLPPPLVSKAALYDPV